MRTLRNMIDFLKAKTDKVIEDIKRMPKVNPRGVIKVSEDSIATISIEEIQIILKADINTVYDTLVASKLHRGGPLRHDYLKATIQMNTSPASPSPQKYAG